MMLKLIHKSSRIDPRQSGSIYIMVLGASLLVALIGVSSLMAVRVQRRAVTITADKIQARELARSGIDRVMLSAKLNLFNSMWRTMLTDGSYENKAFAGGTFSVTGIDPIDGDLTNSNDDPVLLASVGVYGEAKYILQVTINGDGSVQPGTWSRLVQ